MKYLLFALLLIFPLGQLLRGFYINDFATGVVVLVFLALSRKNLHTLVFKDPLFKPLILWFGAMLLSLVLNSTRFSLSELFSSSLYMLRFIMYAGLYFVVRDQVKEKSTVLKLLNLAILVVAIAGLLQFVFLPDVSFLKSMDWDDHYYRLVSTFLDPGFTGAILILGLILAFIEKSYLRSVVIYLAMALTYSRASYLMYMFSAGAIAFYQKSAKLFLGAVLLLAITIPLLPTSTGEGTKLNRENSIFGRLNNWNQTLKIWETRPVFGIGFNTYRFETQVAPESHSGGADSSVLLVLATTGLVGFAAYVNLLKKTWDMGDLIFKASLAGILVQSMFNNTLFYPFVMEWLWVLLALNLNRSKMLS